MAIRQAYYATCDQCSTTLEGDFPEPQLFDSPTEAREAARAHGWYEESRKLVCGDICREQVEVDDARTLSSRDTPAANRGQVNRDDVAQQLPDFLREVYSETLSTEIAESEAYGALVYRVAERLTTGEDVKEIFDALPADDIVFAPSALDPAAFLAARIAKL